MRSYPVLPPKVVEIAVQQLVDAATGLGEVAQREAEHLAARLAPDRWPLEWNLPFWLGQDYALAARAWQHLVTVNALGMGYVRLADDVADETPDGLRLATQTRLGQRFLQASTDLLERLFDRESRLWDCYRAYLDQWARAAAGESAWRAGPRRRIVDDWQWLAWRGAPAKITASGACLLAGRAAVVVPLERCIDHTMAATVLLDHADDWPDDLAAGRFNAYVAWLSDLPQQPGLAAANRQSVLSALMQGDGASHDSYFQLVDAHLAEAQSTAALIESAGLSAYIDALRRDARDQRAGQLAAARDTLRAAVTSLLASING